MNADDDGLADLAGLVLDGTAVDWDAADAHVSPEVVPVVRQLQSIAAIARAHGAELPASWGPLRVLEAVGHGASGDVYRAWDSRLDREVALKMLDRSRSASQASSIIDEGRRLARVRHPNVVTVYGAERIDDRIGLWMEFIDGRTLHQLVTEDRRRFAAPEIAAIGQTLCGAVGAVHAAGLLHRDIKAQNVMMARDGRVVLMDFGSGRDRDAPGASLAGTPLYLAPEVLNGAGPSVQSDIYALGVLLFFLLTGTYPVTGKDLAALRTAHEGGARRSLKALAPGTPGRLARAIERAIEPDPASRHRDVAALAADLAALLPKPRVERLAFAAAVVLAVGLGAGIAWEGAGRYLGVAATPGALATRLAQWAFASEAPVTQPVIAVLPFASHSPEPDAIRLADGLSDEIVRNLAGVPGLLVLSSAASFAFREEPRDLRRLREQLGAALIVEGAVVRTGDRARVTARLAEVSGGMSLWTRQFDEPFDDVLSIPARIASGIVAELGLPAGRPRRHAGTSLEAYDLYLRGRELVGRRGIANSYQAAELFERAIAKDAAFTPAHAGLAMAYAFQSFPYRGISFDRAYPVMRAEAADALRLDPLLAEAHVAMGWVFAYEHDWANADEAFRRALALNPALTEAYTSYSIATLQPQARWADALRMLQAASLRDPLSLDVQREIGEVQLYSGRHAEAVDTLQRVAEIEPDFPFVQAYLGKALTLVGRIEEAEPRFDQGVPWLADVYLKTNRRAEAEKLAAESERYPFRLAIIAAALGDTPRAVAAIERAAATEPHRLGRLLIEPDIAPLRGHPRVVALRKAFGLP